MQAASLGGGQGGHFVSCRRPAPSSRRRPLFLPHLPGQVYFGQTLEMSPFHTGTQCSLSHAGRRCESLYGAERQASTISRGPHTQRRTLVMMWRSQLTVRKQPEVMLRASQALKRAAESTDSTGATSSHVKGSVSSNPGGEVNEEVRELPVITGMVTSQAKYIAFAKPSTNWRSHSQCCRQRTWILWKMTTGSPRHAPEH